jgi:NAD-dependent deacetylase
MKKQVYELAEMIKGSSRIVAFTGAGISAESGVPTYRGEGGVWNKYDPTVYAHIDYFMKDPTLYWSFFHDVRYDVLRKARPNEAHLALARLGKEGKLTAVITQNIDGLHQMAGSRKVLELHGSTRDIYCLDCGRHFTIDQLHEMLIRQNPPPCTHCGGMLRPAVVFFGEGLPEDVLEEATEEAMKCDLMIVIGSSLVVYPAALLPERAKRSGAKLAIINRDPTPLDVIADIVINDSAGEVMAEAVPRGRN